MTSKGIWAFSVISLFAEPRRSPDVLLPFLFLPVVAIDAIS